MWTVVRKGQTWPRSQWQSSIWAILRTRRRLRFSFSRLNITSRKSEKRHFRLGSVAFSCRIRWQGRKRCFSVRTWWSCRTTSRVRLCSTCCWTQSSLSTSEQGWAAANCRCRTLVCALRSTAHERTRAPPSRAIHEALRRLTLRQILQCVNLTIRLWIGRITSLSRSSHKSSLLSLLERTQQNDAISSSCRMPCHPMRWRATSTKEQRDVSPNTFKITLSVRMIWLITQLLTSALRTSCPTQASTLSRTKSVQEKYDHE